VSAAWLSAVCVPPACRPPAACQRTWAWQGPLSVDRIGYPSSLRRWRETHISTLISLPFARRFLVPFASSQQWIDNFDVPLPRFSDNFNATTRELYLNLDRKEAHLVT